MQPPAASEPPATPEGPRSAKVAFPLHYLLGSHGQLAPAWKAYHMESLTTEDGIVVHTTGVYVIHATGHARSPLTCGRCSKALRAGIVEARWATV